MIFTIQSKLDWTSTLAAKTTLNSLCRKFDPSLPTPSPHHNIPNRVLPAEQTLTAADAKDTLTVIGQLSNNKKPCFVASNQTIYTVDDLANGLDTGSHHHHIPNIEPQLLTNASTKVRELYGQAKASVTQ
jgi:hypothetical protein